VLADAQASERALQFEFGWFGDPIIFGDYPAVMRQLVGGLFVYLFFFNLLCYPLTFLHSTDRLPQFTPEESQLLRNASTDFFGINHYSSVFVYNVNTKPDNRLVLVSLVSLSSLSLSLSLSSSFLSLLLPFFPAFFVLPSSISLFFLTFPPPLLSCPSAGPLTEW
jgi:hypothetical protein